MEIQLKAPESLDIENPAPGIYPGVPFSAYCQVDAVNQTSLKVLHDISPREYRIRLEEDTDTPARQFGRGVHTAWLEAHEFRNRYAVWDGERKGAEWKALKRLQACWPNAPKEVGVSLANSRNCKEWKSEKWEERQTIRLLEKEWRAIFFFARANDSKEAPFDTREIITQSEFDAIMDAAETLAQHPLTEKLKPSVDRQQWRELTLIWMEDAMVNQGVTGHILCKARLDLVHVDEELVPYIYDLKTTRRKTRAEFAKDAHNLGYDFQAEWYCRGFRKLTGIRLEPWQFRFLTIESEHLDVNEYWLPEGAFTDFARVAVDRALDSLAHCRATDRWPGANDDRPDELTEYFPWKAGSGATAASLSGFSEPTPIPEAEEFAGPLN